TNNGTLLGFVTLGDGDDTLTNNGLFSAEGDSDFGLGSDLFTNSSDFIVASGGSVAINGLEIFANTALVSLADGAIGNNLTVSGDFAGSGNSMLGLDVDFSASAADVLTVGGAATGATTLGINVVGGTPNTLFADILVVDAGAGSSETAFTLMGGRQTIGLIEFDVAFDATSNDFFLATAPSLAAFEASNFAETARGVWQQSADAFSAQMATDRDGEGSSSSNLAGGQDSAARAWITGFGGNLDRERDVSTNVNGIANQFNLGYDQDAFGALAGVDFGSNTVRYGITGGYISSEARFAGSPNRVDYDVLTIGAYVALDTGPLFASLLAKYDTINGQLTSATGGVSSELDGSAFGVQGEVGALVGDRTGFFFEPSASLAYNNADLDGVTTTQGSFAFEEGDSLLGKIGARLGSGFSSGDTPGAIYIGARYVHEFEGEDSVIFSSGGQTATFGNLPVDDYAELTAGVALGGDDDALSGGFRGQVLVGEDVSGFGVSANLLFRF
ncbi:MAG: autotransporter outer membrane beta-barrel domain-containing protein, partial [Pseudomonadota bacterium]